MRRTKSSAIIFSTGGLVLALGAYLILARGGEGISSQGALLQPDDPEIVSLGSSVYVENCASCHGPNREGQVADWRSPGPDGKLPAPPHDETGHTWHHTDALLFRLTKLGVAKAANLENYSSGMPAYDGILTDAEIIAVLSFIKSTWPEDIQRRHDQLNASAGE